MSAHTLSVRQLADCYLQSDVVVIDARFALADPGLGERQYAQGHIPGAVYLHLDRDLSGPKAVHGGRHPLPDPQALAQTFAAAGINSAPPSLVVVYDDSRFGFAARVWWLLRWLGHERVQLLDGGFAAWRAAELPVSDTPAMPRRATFVPRVRAEMVVDKDYVEARKAGAALIDSREERRYLGLEEPIDPVAGHIPGARNFPWQQVTDDKGLLRDADAQRQRWGDVAAADEIVVYCGSGVTACVNLLALAEAGRDDAKLYAGSWSDWSSYR